MFSLITWWRGSAFHYGIGRDAASPWYTLKSQLSTPPKAKSHLTDRWKTPQNCWRNHEKCWKRSQWVGLGSSRNTHTHIWCTTFAIDCILCKWCLKIRFFNLYEYVVGVSLLLQINSVKKTFKFRTNAMGKFETEDELEWLSNSIIMVY